MGRKGKSIQGSKKVEMKKIKSEEEREVYFLNQTKKAFKKAHELSALGGAEVGLLVYSPSGIPHSFGSPSVEQVFHRFSTGKRVDGPDELQILIDEHNEEYMELSKRVDAAKAKRKEQEERIKQAAAQAKECEWMEKIDQLGRDELFQLLGALYRAKCTVNERMSAIFDQAAPAPSNMSKKGTVPSGMAQSVSAPPPPVAEAGTSN